MNTITINRILVPVDLNHVAPDFMKLVIAMSQRHEAEIRLLYVIDPDQYTFPAVDGLVVSMSHDEVIATEIQRLQQWADSILTDHSTVYSVECRTGMIADQIAEAATDFRADLIVMGTQGSRGLLQYVMGSEAYHVINQAPCPVLTVPEQANVRDFKKILFPVRPVPGTVTKYEVTRTIARKNNAHLTVLGITDELDSETGKAINIDMAELNKHIADDALEADSILSQTGSAVDTVLQEAEQHQADLIIITADRPTNIRHLFVGPFFKQIISQAKCPVLSIRPEVPVQHQTTRGEAIPLFPVLNPFGLSGNPV